MRIPKKQSSGERVLLFLGGCFFGGFGLVILSGSPNSEGLIYGLIFGALGVVGIGASVRGYNEL